jgi:hypothetical protein
VDVPVWRAPKRMWTYGAVSFRDHALSTHRLNIQSTS